MPEYRHVRSGSLNIPSGADAASNSSMMPRSPPSKFTRKLPALHTAARCVSAQPHQRLPCELDDGRCCPPRRPRWSWRQLQFADII